MIIRVFGDWHGNTRYALKQLEAAGGEADVYVHVGDFGVWPDTVNPKDPHSFLNLLEKELASQNKELWFIDGNHEYFPILENLEKDARGLGMLSPHVFHIPRGHSWEWDGKKFLGVGGAVSIDRNYRRLGHSYFKEEEITLADVNKAKSVGKVDVMFSHDAPILPVPKKFFGKDIDEDASASINKVAEITASVEPELLIHGHYHIAYSKAFLDTAVIGLDCDTGPYENNFVDINSEELRG